MKVYVWKLDKEREFWQFLDRNLKGFVNLVSIHEIHISSFRSNSAKCTEYAIEAQNFHGKPVLLAQNIGTPTSTALW